jgi:RNA polymerase sigma-70 factor (ECF subfamily)
MALVHTQTWEEGSAVLLKGIPATSQSDDAAGADHEAFQSFVERNLRFAFRVAYALLRNRSDAEDVVQDSFLRLYRKRAWRGLQDEHAFLARVVWRSARDRQRRPQYEDSGVELDAMPAIGRSPESTAVATAALASIHRLIDTLPKELRQPLVLAALEEMTSAQIAAVLGIPEGTVRNRIQRARALLKQKLAQKLAAKPSPEKETRHAR